MIYFVRGILCLLFLICPKYSCLASTFLQMYMCSCQSYRSATRKSFINQLQNGWPADLWHFCIIHCLNWWNVWFAPWFRVLCKFYWGKWNLCSVLFYRCFLWSGYRDSYLWKLVRIILLEGIAAFTMVSFNYNFLSYILSF